MKRFQTHFGLIFLVLVWFGCSVKKEIPTSISIGFSQPEEVDPLTFKTDHLEYQIDEVFLVVSAVELHLCIEPQVSFSIISSAYAHVSGSTTRLGTPVVLPLHTQKSSPTIIGEISPPIGKYCHGYIIVAPADDDVMNLTDLSTDNIVGKSLFIRGRFRDPMAIEWADFEQAVDIRRPVAFKITDPKTGADNLTLSSGSNAQITIDVMWPINDKFMNVEDSQFSSQIVSRITESLKMRNYKK